MCGGAFGVEPLIGYSGPGHGLLLIAVTPLVFSLPNVLMVRELGSMMPVEGSYYHWVKRAFGPFAEFMVKVHNKHGAPWIAIILAGIIFTIFSWQAFAFLVVADGFLQSLVILAELGALLYFPIQRWTKAGVHDVDPYRIDDEAADA